jgi:hypothetical protein
MQMVIPELSVVGELKALYGLNVHNREKIR